MCLCYFNGLFHKQTKPLLFFGLWTKAILTKHNQQHYLLWDETITWQRQHNRHQPHSSSSVVCEREQQKQFLILHSLSAAALILWYDCCCRCCCCFCFSYTFNHLSCFLCVKIQHLFWVSVCQCCHWHFCFFFDFLLTTIGSRIFSYWNRDNSIFYSKIVLIIVCFLLNIFFEIYF